MDLDRRLHVLRRGEDLGAAIQGGVLGGEVKDVLLLDVTPLSLGIETLGSVTTVLIPRNSTIPLRKSETFSTAADNQTSVEVHVLQGERELAVYNRTIGKFQLTGIPPAPRGMPQVEVTFDIDANGIVHVAAKDVATGKEQRIAITASSGLNKDEVDRMVKDAQAHSAEDKGRRELIDARNQADSLAYAAEKTLNENRTKVEVGTASSLESAIASLRDAVKGDDLAAIKAASEQVQRASHAVAEQLYKAQAASQSGPAGGAGTGGGSTAGRESDVVDGEVVEV